MVYYTPQEVRQFYSSLEGMGGGILWSQISGKNQKNQLSGKKIVKTLFSDSILPEQFFFLVFSDKHNINICYPSSLVDLATIIELIEH